VNQFDILLRQGYFAKGETLNRPYVPGSDASGIVVQKGRNVTEFKLGDRVYTTISTKTGTYANFAVCSVLNGTVHRLPEDVSFAAGACYGLPYFLGYRILARIARLPSGGNLLVKGIFFKKYIFQNRMFRCKWCCW